MSNSSSSPGKLSPDQLNQLLRETIIARLGTITEDGYPYVVPIWTEWDGQYIWLVARAKAQYIKNILQNPKVSLSIVKDDLAGTRVLFLGHAEIIDGPGPLNGQMLEIARRMARRYEGEEGERYIEESLNWPRYLIRVVAEKTLSWDSPDWHPKYKP